MASFSISEVEELTGVKAHILRYWEEAIAGFSVQKDIGGRRVYSQNDVDTILRLKHLINEKKMTTKNAMKQLIEDAAVKSQNIELAQEIHNVRSELAELYLQAKEVRKNSKENTSGMTTSVTPNSREDLQ